MKKNKFIFICFMMAIISAIIFYNNSEEIISYFENKEWEIADSIGSISINNYLEMESTLSNLIVVGTNYIKGYSNIFRIYCNLKKEHKELQYFDFGGGLPVKYSLEYSFDYEDLINKIVQKSKEIADINNVDSPDLIGEHGRYTVADHSLFIYKVDFTKQYYNSKWYVLNTSIMNMTPDTWAINQEFTILPVNMWEKEFNSVLIGGETCDPDDRYYINNKNIELPMPKIDEGEDLYIAIFSVGAYQESISGIGGVHHCMIPEGAEIIIYNNGKNVLKVNDVQTEEEMLEILGYRDARIDKIFE